VHLLLGARVLLPNEALSSLSPWQAVNITLLGVGGGPDDDSDSSAARSAASVPGKKRIAEADLSGRRLRNFVKFPSSVVISMFVGSKLKKRRTRNAPPPPERSAKRPKPRNPSVVGRLRPTALDKLTVLEFHYGTPDTPPSGYPHSVAETLAKFPLHVSDNTQLTRWKKK
jgi:hypothetical protein